MSQTYKIKGIVLKSMPLGEADRLIVILSPSKGLIRAVAPGSRKNKSPLSGRSELFMVNKFFMVKGHSLDKIIQAETLQFYPGLRKDLIKLIAAQYLSELILNLSIDIQPQEELYELFNEHLRRLEKMSLVESLYGYLAQAIFHFLVVTGIGPQVYQCCLTQEKLTPNFRNPSWCVGFSYEMGGLINLNSPAYIKKN
ncbi:MAG: DNA replication and repair protein RecO [Candidatus Atelocyanobacterium thalassa isolate SIO64986]|uniref:DNA repair protein RecO n=1 Tax=Candidatus Atelocyanobacterium thalassa isolate SIO64986 TaxID=1527444 RepID=A0A086CHP3_9CHRO|nr:MAG: DNA replication and repair protein RecO [Candidatus Atelocyanobacterium thalassa isolate SIO64986]